MKIGRGIEKETAGVGRDLHSEWGGLVYCSNDGWARGDGSRGSLPFGHPLITSDHRVLINFSAAISITTEEIRFFHGVQKRGVKMHISLVFLINILCLGSMLTVSHNELCRKQAAQRTKGNFPLCLQMCAVLPSNTMRLEIVYPCF